MSERDPISLTTEIVAVINRYRLSPNESLEPWVAECMFMIAACVAACVAGVAPADEFIAATDAVAKRAGAITTH